MVPPGWQHPKMANGDSKPLMKGPFSKHLANWDEAAAAWERGEVEDWAPGDGPKKWKPKAGSSLEYESYAEWADERPKAEDYMPEFEPGTATMLVMYENTSEGTPISPAFATPEELARWLADNNASAFGGMTATYEQWLSTCKAGWAPSMMMSVSPSGGGTMMSGVEAMAEPQY